MAGHSKWANIKHRKASQDAKRAKIWTKLIREVTIAARMGGGDPEDNPRLRLAMDKALGANMPKDTMERAIKRGAGGEDGADVEELTYEGYGPGGVAFLVEAMTDNRNRTAAEVRHAFTKHGGNLGTDGSVAYLFTNRGVISFEPGVDEEVVMEAALGAGADDLIEDEDGSVTVYAPPAEHGDVVAALQEQGLEPGHSEIMMVPSTTSDCDIDTAQTNLRLIDTLEDLDDVQNVYTNGAFPAEAYE